MNRNEAIEQIRAGLKARSKKRWSVRGGSGTAWGWITISAPPARCEEFGRMSEEDSVELSELLAHPNGISRQGVSVPSSSAYYREYVDRANGRELEVLGTQYWD